MVSSWWSGILVAPVFGAVNFVLAKRQGKLLAIIALYSEARK
jgi:hypothetical protein